MRKITLITTLLVVAVFISGCGAQEQALTEEQQAEKYGMTLEEYRETKEGAARMNMTAEEHMKMLEE